MDEDKKLAKLLFLKPSTGLVESSMKKINKIIEAPALESHTTPKKEQKVAKLLGTSTKTLLTSNVLGIVKKRDSSNVIETETKTIVNKIPKIVCDYGSSTSDSD